MRTLDEAEFKLYKKYKRSRILDEEDRSSIYDLCLTGEANTGLRLINNIPTETARLSECGIIRFKKERICHNPLTNILYHMANIFS